MNNMQSCKQSQCRLCLGNVYRMHNFQQTPNIKDFEMSIPESIEDFFKIKVSADDCYSKFICGNCLTIIHMMHLHRKMFQNRQKELDPVDQLKSKDTDQMISDNSQKPNKKIWDSETDIPSKNFNAKNPTVVVSFEERKLANEAARVKWSLNKTEDKKPKFIEVKYKKQQKSEPPFKTNADKFTKVAKKPYVARNLVQEQFSGDICRENPEAENLWDISLQMSVFVCNICENIFEKYHHFRSHKKIHDIML